MERIIPDGLISQEAEIFPCKSSIIERLVPQPKHSIPINNFIKQGGAHFNMLNAFNSNMKR